MPREVGKHGLDLDPAVKANLVSGPTSEAPVVLRCLRDRHLEIGAWDAWAMAEAALRAVRATEGLPGILAAL